MGPPACWGWAACAGRGAAPRVLPTRGAQSRRGERGHADDVAGQGDRGDPVP
jgi:hypothetical protein